MDISWFVRTSGVLSTTVICLLHLVRPTTTADLQASAVNVSIYLTTLEQWNGGVKSSFETALLEKVYEFCMNDRGACGLTQLPSKFQNVTYQHQAAYQKPQLNFSIAVPLPSDAVPTGTYLQKNALQIITINSRTHIKSSSGADISMVDIYNYGPNPDPVLNGVVSAVFAVAVLVLGIAVCILNNKCTEGYEKWVEPKPGTENAKEAKKADDCKKGKKKNRIAERDSREEIYSPTKRVLTPVERIAPEPVSKKESVPGAEAKVSEENQNGDAPVVTVVGREGVQELEIAEAT